MDILIFLVLLAWCVLFYRRLGRIDGSTESRMEAMRRDMNLWKAELGTALLPTLARTVDAMSDLVSSDEL